MTNLYETPHQVCLNGEFFSQYFLDYISKVLTSLRANKTAKPLLSYMHFNTGHEYTGVRMINMDAMLAKFAMEMAQSPDTFTLIFSDHGNRNTKYSYTDEGRREFFDPLLFMLIPDGVAEKLGQQRMAALVENQKRFFTLLEVHKALMILNDPQKINPQNSTEAGIFAVLPESRTCEDVKLLPLAKCKCEGFDDYSQAKDNSKNHKWLAEFALGTLNNAIQAQHMKGKLLLTISSHSQVQCSVNKRGSFESVVEILIKRAASRGSFHCFLVKTFGNKLNQEKIRGQRGIRGALAGRCEFHLIYFYTSFKRKSVFRDVRKRSV